MATLAPTIRPAELDQRVEIQEETRTSDGQGGYTSSWVVQDTVWAKVRPLRGSEREHADRIQAEGGYMVIIRWRGDLDETWRVRWVNRDRLMNIRFIQDGGQRELYLQIECEKGVAV